MDVLVGSWEGDSSTHLLVFREMSGEKLRRMRTTHRIAQAVQASVINCQTGEDYEVANLRRFFQNQNNH